MHEEITSQTVSDWLNAHDRTSAGPVRVTIGRTTYVGAFYAQTRDISPGCRAYADGERTYRQSGYYLLGALPASYRRKRATVYADPADDRPCYVVGWFGQDGDRPLAVPLSDDDARKFHPFGSMFMLGHCAADHEQYGGHNGCAYDHRPMIVDHLANRKD